MHYSMEVGLISLFKIEYYGSSSTKGVTLEEVYYEYLSLIPGLLRKF